MVPIKYWCCRLVKSGRAAPTVAALAAAVVVALTTATAGVPVPHGGRQRVGDAWVLSTTTNRSAASGYTSVASPFTAAMGKTHGTPPVPDMPADLQGTTRTSGEISIVSLCFGIAASALVALCACAKCYSAEVAGDAAPPAARPTADGAGAAQATAQLKEGTSALSDGDARGVWGG